jgi:flagellar FliL protein
MSDEPAADQPDDAPRAPRPPKVVLGLLGVNLLLSVGILIKLLGSPAHVAAAHASPHAKEGEHRTKEVVGPMTTLDAFVVNLDEPGTPRYLKVQLQLEMKDGAAVRALEKNKTLVRDAVLGYLSGLTLEKTLGAGNKDQIRTELAVAIAEIIGDERVLRVVFAEFVVQ